MCGIAGIISGALSAANIAARLKSMAERIRHRGPDADGFFVSNPITVITNDASGGTSASGGGTSGGGGAAAFVVGLAHRRLSILDLSPRGNQPMRSPDGQITVVLNGEIYNFADLRADLEAAGHRFVSQTDTEVLLHGYREWGEGVLQKLVGMFAFAVWDAPAQKLFLARDRAGEKPLFYADTAAGFAFASEFGALADWPDIDDSIDRDALAQYLQFQYVPAPLTIFRGIKKLPPACQMVWQAGRLTRVAERYWDPRPFAIAPRLALSEADAVDALREKLTAAVRGQMIADVPLGAFLSGGIDSSVVVATMCQLAAGHTAAPTANETIKTFTIGFEADGYDESAHAAAVAQHLGTAHTAEFLTEQAARDLIPRIPKMYGEPFADSSALPTFLVSRIARRHVTVALTGDGGDELFGGYANYDQLEKLAPWARATAPLAPLAPLLRPLVGCLPGRAGRAATLIGQPVGQVYRRLMSLFLPHEVRAMLGDVPKDFPFDGAWRRPYPASWRRRAMLSDFIAYLPEALLVKVDRAAMAVSLETRAPLLDHRLIEFSLQLPTAMVYRKRLLKQLAYRFVPQPLLDRPKMGFGVPLGRWFRGPLREWFHDTVTPTTLAAVGIHDFSVIRHIVAEHEAGRRDHGHRMWALAVLAMWSAETFRGKASGE